MASSYVTGAAKGVGDAFGILGKQGLDHHYETIRLNTIQQLGLERDQKRFDHQDDLQRRRIASTETEGTLNRASNESLVGKRSQARKSEMDHANTIAQESKPNYTDVTDAKGNILGQRESGTNQYIPVNKSATSKLSGQATAQLKIYKEEINRLDDQIFNETDPVKKKTLEIKRKKAIKAQNDLAGIAPAALTDRQALALAQKVESQDEVEGVVQEITEKYGEESGNKARAALEKRFATDTATPETTAEPTPLQEDAVQPLLDLDRVKSGGDDELTQQLTERQKPSGLANILGAIVNPDASNPETADMLQDHEKSGATVAINRFFMKLQRSTPSATEVRQVLPFLEQMNPEEKQKVLSLANGYNLSQ